MKLNARNFAMLQFLYLLLPQQTLLIANEQLALRILRPAQTENKTLHVMYRDQISRLTVNPSVF